MNDSRRDRAFQDELERRVAERTAELEADNAALRSELERYRETEASLRRSEERFRTLFEHAPVMIDAFDEHGRCQLWNRECERQLGWTRQDVMEADDPLALFYPDPDERARVLESIREGNGTFHEYEVQAKDGSRRAQMWANFRLPSAQMIAVGLDVSERRRVEEQLRHIQKLDALGRLTGGIAHDFNNLLTVILTHCHAVRRLDGSDPQTLRTRFAEIEEAAERGARLVRRLLSFGRHDDLHFRVVDLAEQLDESAKDLRRLLPETIEIRVECEPDLPPVSADSDALEQILLNLATNARDAMEGRGVLEVALRQQLAAPAGPRAGRHVVLSVSDTGTGMDDRTRRQAFEPFYTTKPAGQGTGLGLPTVYGLLRQHGGTLEVHSEPGRGSRFELWFPAVSGDSVPAGDERSERREQLPGAQGTVLLVEDEPQVRKTTHRLLEEAGYGVTAVPDGERALAELQRDAGAIAVVLCDVIMPGMTGPELYARVRDWSNAPPFVFASGYAGSDEGTPLPQDGTPRVTKPWEPEELIDTLQQVQRTDPRATRVGSNGAQSP
jgi:PAS domain S-box-containing protein